MTPSGCRETEGICYVYTWNKNIKSIAKFKGQNRTCRNDYQNRCKGYKNGSLLLSNISTEDSGYYHVDLHNITGVLVAKFWFLLQIQDPVSKPMVNYSCLEDGKIQVSCSVQNGTDPKYSWTKEGISLMENCTYSQNGICTILMTSQVLREVICIVKNQISENISHSINVSCLDPVSKPMVNYSCLEDGKIQVSCSVQNGTDPKYSWTKEGMSLMENCTYSQNGICTILMTSQVLREVICIVKNQISENISHSINVSCLETSTSALAPTLISNELPVTNSTVEGKPSDNTTMPNKTKNVTSKGPECLNHCIMKSAIGGSVVFLVTGLALILGCLCTMPKE
nr:carcinoembryonic antigen-related cell adhesion molecule 2-like isoform X2 [Geotrypetes seraphini]